MQMLSLLAILGLPTDPAAALRQVDAGAAALQNVRYVASRTTDQGQIHAEERWVFAGEAGGRFRVDYVGDTPRQVACDGRVLWDYIPSMHAAQRVNLVAMSDEERARILGGVLSRVSIPGLRTGLDASGMSNVTWGEDGTVNGRPVRTVIATNDKGGKLTFTLDAAEGYLVSSRIEENGVFVVSTEGAEFKEVAPDVWVPSRVISTSPAPGGKVRVEIQLIQLVIGDDLPDQLFSLSLDPSVQVRELP